MAKKIMIVDDDHTITKFLDTLFRDNGFETCIANDGKKAVEVFESEKPDLITLDLEMPEEWGPRFYRKISKKKGFNTPVIVISGLPNIKYSIPKAFAAFGKPFDAEKVLDAVDKALK